ncbi:MAG: ribokinase [Spirochaetes bacterium]|uniref:Ribokinase n=1 Tax=Candidatus Ornithospirochaeta stercoripullorum TaxID=2840899 RepID=A0A9D9DY69_9SPIO|nr:ribokinase [Candidatus Ornithospirochaeta stercoripullorum]
MKYLVLGSVNIDLTFRVDHIVNAGETLASESVSRNAGGKGANQAAALGKAGLEAYYGGKLGEDGEWILSKLRSFGVDTSLSVISSDCHTGQAIIQIDKSGQNCIVLDAGGNKMIDDDEIDSILSHFSAGDVIIMQNEVNSIATMMEKAHEKGMRICFNPSPFEDYLMTLPLSYVDTFFVNEIEGRTMAGWDKVPSSDEEFRELASDLLSIFPSAKFVLTAGKKGAYCVSAKDGIAYAPIVDYPVVDTTGAGDTFCGFFLAATERGMSNQEALEKASIASGIAVSRLGAMESMPFGKEVFGV